jgi:hypothetical protein
MAQGSDTSLSGQSSVSTVNLVPPSVVESARVNLAVAKRQYDAGVGDQLAVLEAEQHLQWAEAMFAGDRVAAASATCDGTKKRLALMEKKYKAGLLDFTEMAPVERDLADAEALLSELKIKPESYPAVPAVRIPGIDWKSFWLGAVATGALLLSAKVLIFLSQRWQRSRHERELRRIASLDG